MAAYIAAADAIRAEFSCAVIVIHHCGVERSRPRGHTSLTGAADAQIAVKRKAGGVIVAKVEWMKDGAEGEIVTSRLEIVEVGEDVDGDKITSCVVIAADARDAPQCVRLPKSARMALELLKIAVAKSGESSPASNHVPVGITAVRIDQWRDSFYAGTVTESGNPESQRRAFYRANEKLQNINAIGIGDGWVWVAEKATGTCGTDRDTPPPP